MPDKHFTQLLQLKKKIHCTRNCFLQKCHTFHRLRNTTPIPSRNNKIMGSELSPETLLFPQQKNHGFSKAQFVPQQRRPWF